MLFSCFLLFSLSFIKLEVKACVVTLKLFWWTFPILEKEIDKMALLSLMCLEIEFLFL